MLPALHALPYQTGAWEEESERASAALLESGSILLCLSALLPVRLQCPLLACDQMAQLWFSKGVQVRKEKFVFPVREMGFHTLLIPNVGRKDRSAASELPRFPHRPHMLPLPFPALQVAPGTVLQSLRTVFENHT